MTIENNGPESAYPGPAEPNDDGLQPEGGGETDRNDLTDDPDMPVSPPVDEAEEP
jgi:hypothetical protein